MAQQFATHDERASAVVIDDHGRILLQRRRDNDLLALPGGGMDRR